jgi:hypothetical protein
MEIEIISSALDQEVTLEIGYSGEIKSGWYSTGGKIADRNLQRIENHNYDQLKIADLTEDWRNGR